MNDSQDRFGVSHLAYLAVLVVRPPVSLRRVDGSPVLGLLRRLRDHGARALQAIPRSVGAERIERDLGVPFIPLNGVVLHRPARRREPIAKTGRSAPGALRFRHCSSGCAVPPLEIGIQAVELSPYHAGLAGPCLQCLPTSPASRACSFPLRLSPSGQPDDPETSLRVPPD
jgi:hypothetical protein